MARARVCVRFLLVVAFASLVPLIASAQPFSEQNVNMVSGTQYPGGDPWLRQQNEPSMAVSTRNPLHLLAGANDYRSVDIPFNAPSRPDDEDTGDAWLGVFESKDGGNTWFSTLLDGYPQLTNSTSPLKGFQAAADPVVRAANNGLFYYAGIVLNRGNNPLGGVFVARFIDRNNTEIANPIAYLETKMLDKGTSGQFIDKPWLAVAPMTNGGQCTVDGQTIAARNVYLAYSVFVGNDNNIRTKIIFTRSTDCGATWATPIKLSETYTINQGVSLAVDPSNGNNVYVAWRRFKGGTDLDSIVLAKSTNAGASFAKGVVVRNITPFEQGTTGASIRTNAYPTMAVDSGGRVHIAWSHRDSVSGDGQIVLITSLDGGTSWSPTPKQIDVPPGRGHQFMPSMTFAAGKLTIAWYDLRQDHTIGTYLPTNPFTGFYDETRTAVGNLALNQASVVFWNYLQDVSPNTLKLVRRHTLDVRVAEADPAAVPAFTSTRATRYKYGFAQGYSVMQDLQIDPPNLPMFRQGTVPFFGDYIDVAAYVNAPGTARVRHVVWTDNRDVRPPIGSPPDWTKYTPVGSTNGTSTFDPTQKQPPCDPIATGSRNQNIYTTRVTDGVFAGSPGNAKPLGTIQRAFTVFVQNARSTEATYTLTIVPPGASFLQFPPITHQITVTIPPHSTATRTVFVNAPAGTSVDVNVNEVGGAGLSTVVGLNSDLTNPPNPDIGNSEVFNPDIGNPDIGNPDIGNQGVPTPDIGNPDIGNPDIGNPDIGNPDIGNPDIGNPDIGNPDIGNPDIGNSGIANGSATDTGYDAQNQGNTTGGYTVKLLKNGDLPEKVLSQLILSKTYDTPTAHGCTPGVEHHRQLVVNINNPTPASVADLTNPSLLDPNAATMWLAPGEVGRITIRLIDPFHKGLTLDATSYFTPVVIAHSVNTADANGEFRRPPITLTITTRSVPDAIAGQAYSTQFAAIGGKPPYSWNVNVPEGFTADSFGVVSGTFPTMGPATISVTVTDSATKPHTATRRYALNVATPITINTESLARGMTGEYYYSPLQASGGSGKYTWSVSTGSLPSSVTLDPGTGVITGNFSVPSDSSVTLQATDAAQASNFARKTFTLHVVDPLLINSQVPDGVIGSYSTQFTAVGGVGARMWTLGADSAVYNLTADGLFSFNFRTAGDKPVTVQVSDSDSPPQVVTGTITVHIYNPLTINTTTLPNAVQGFAYSTSLNSIGGKAPIHWSIESGSVPDDMTLSDGGLISGICPFTETPLVKFRATDSSNPPQSVISDSGVTDYNGQMPLYVYSAVCTGESFRLYTNSNIDAVQNGGKAASFTTSGQTYCLSSIVTYHWNGDPGNGATPGTIGLLFNKRTIGPWNAVGSPGQNTNGAPVNWTAVPDPQVIILNGDYTVIDSDPATWSQNAGSNGFGFIWIFVRTAQQPSF